YSKIGEVMRHIYLLDAAKVLRDDEFHFRDRARALVDRWSVLLTPRSPDSVAVHQPEDGMLVELQQSSCVDVAIQVDPAEDNLQGPLRDKTPDWNKEATDVVTNAATPDLDDSDTVDEWDVVRALN
ncbi:hypothetical protein C8R45DRAFT_829845, partial [Mycena sanguinolenta]